MAERCRIGLVGCGHWGQHVLRDLVVLECEVFVVARSESSRRRALEGGARAIVQSIDALPPVDGAVVVTPTTTHAEAIKSLLDRQIPIFVEKPLTADPGDAARLVDLASDRLFVMDKWRYHPGVERLAEIARSQELGRVVGLRTARVGWGRDDLDIDVTWHLAPHDLAIALEILGDIPSPRCAIAEYADENPVGLVAILGRDPWLMFDISERRRKHFREVRLVCRDGIAVLPDSYSDHVVVTRNPDSLESKPPDTEHWPISTELPLLRELRAFVDYVLGGPEPRSRAAEGLIIVETIADLRALAGISENGR